MPSIRCFSTPIMAPATTRAAVVRIHPTASGLVGSLTRPTTSAYDTKMKTIWAAACIGLKK
jgi:hypothetical protein